MSTTILRRVVMVVGVAMFAWGAFTLSDGDPAGVVLIIAGLAALGVAIVEEGKS